MFERSGMDSESFIFDDDLEEIGADVEAFCPRCKADTPHTIITKYEDEIRRVQCSSCAEIHVYRRPRGETDEEAPPPEPPPVKKRQGPKKLNWEEFFKKHSANERRGYSFRESFNQHEVVQHPTFGLGFVSEILSDDKVEITFEDTRRILVQSRKALPGAPPELARPPRPAKPKPVKQAKPVKPIKDLRPVQKARPVVAAVPKQAAQVKPKPVAARPSKPGPQPKAKAAGKGGSARHPIARSGPSVKKAAAGRSKRRAAPSRPKKKSPTRKK